MTRTVKVKVPQVTGSSLSLVWDSWVALQVGFEERYGGRLKVRHPRSEQEEVLESVLCGAFFSYEG